MYIPKYLQKISINEKLTTIHENNPFIYSESLKEFVVHTDNQKYSSQNGILLN